MVRIIALILAGLLLAGCEGMSRQQMGAVAGGVGGAALGTQIGSGRGAILATGAGALLGALIGSRIGSRLDERDRQEAAVATHQALEKGETGETYRWRNEESGNSGTVTPLAVGSGASSAPQRSGQTCREFEQTISADGETEAARGVACRQADGSWQVVS